jgi:hypothetical protein
MGLKTAVVVGEIALQELGRGVGGQGGESVERRCDGA